ncbi:MAG: M10 family metallopeptidase C-terminal domain-containing protein [Crocosphaera sp.]|nr:M10 family metallopeptidase C-terminal domain-containing protein [Crocosphaera sp.]
MNNPLNQDLTTQVLQQQNRDVNQDNQHTPSVNDIRCACPSCCVNSLPQETNTANNTTSGNTSSSSNSEPITPPIDAVLSRYKWTLDSDRVITYSFYEDDDFANSYYGSETGVNEVSNAVKNNYREIFAWLENVIDVDFVEVDETNKDTYGQIRIQNSDNPGYAYAYYPTSPYSKLAGDVHLNSSYDRFGDLNGFRHDPGEHGNMTLWHELGHALGLKHTFDTNNGGIALPDDLDNIDSSIMTYTKTGSPAATFMPLDIAALQQLYGAKTHNEGDTTYVFGGYIDQVTVDGVSLVETSNRTKQLLWDSGGTDTLDFSGLNAQSSGFHLDLRGGGLLSNTFRDITSYSTALAYGFEVENVVNSRSNDNIYLNDVANEIRGYGDRFTGQDKIYYGSNEDILRLDYASNQVTQTQNGQNLIIDLGSNGSVELVDYYADPNNQIQIVYTDSPIEPNPDLNTEPNPDLNTEPNPDLNTEPNPDPDPTPKNMIIAEMGQVNDLTHNSQTIVLNHEFINPVIFAQPLSYNGPDPSIVRITDIQSDRFSAFVQETTLIDQNTHSGGHTKETFSFFVVEQGVWELSDGTIIEVGNVTTDATTRSNWQNITFQHDFSDTPVVLTQVQTDNDATFVRTRQQNTTKNGFQVALEQEEAYLDTGHGSETIAWLAISPGQGNWDGSTFIAGNTGDQVTHNWHTLDFGNTFSTTPQFLGNIAGYDGSDSSGLRYQNLSNGQVEIMIEEDTSKDDEIKHTTENVNFFAIEKTGTLTGTANADALIGLVEQQLGTANKDTFVVGNAQESLYDTYGQQDYLEISGFDASQDVIQLHGTANHYSIGAFPSGSNDQGIFLKVAGMEDELVAVVKNSDNLDLNSKKFAFA